MEVNEMILKNIFDVFFEISNNAMLNSDKNMRDLVTE